MFCVWRPWMKWPLLALLAYFVITNPERAADATVAIWNGLITLAEGLFSFVQAIFDRI